MSLSMPIDISGYVLAGGRSSRMGRDKALIPLAGRPLIEHAVSKLRRICADVRILSPDPALAAFAPILPDLHPNCGPIGGIEVALVQTTHDWNAFLPVDMPLLPTALLAQWISDALEPSSPDPLSPGIRIFNADSRPHPALCLIHKAILPLVARAIQREEFALISVFEEIGREGKCGFSNPPSISSLGESLVSAAEEPWQSVTEAQFASRHLWFLNLNTKEDLALAEANIAALDT